MTNEDNDKTWKKLYYESLFKQALAEEQAKRNRQYQIADAKRAGKSIDESAEADQLWAKVEEQANELIIRGQQGYDSFISTVNAIMVAAMVFQKALRASRIPESILSLIVFNQYSKSLWRDVHGAFAKKFMKGVEYPTVDTNDVKCDANGNVNLDTAEFYFTSDIKDNDGKTTGTDKIACDENQRSLLAKGTEEWLAHSGYKRASESSYQFVNDEGEHLTPEVFNALKNNPERGLQKFFSGDYDMKPEPVPGPRP